MTNENPTEEATNEPAEPVVEPVVESAAPPVPAEQPASEAPAEAADVAPHVVSHVRRVAEILPGESFVDFVVRHLGHHRHTAAVLSANGYPPDFPGNFPAGTPFELPEVRD